MTALLACARRVSDSPQKLPLVQDGLAILRETLAADVAVFAEVVDGSQLAFYVRGGVESPEPAALQTLAAEDSLAAYALATMRPVLLESLSSEGRFSDAFLQSMGVVSGFAVPIRLATNPVGVVGVYRREPGQFSAEAREFAETIGHLLSLALGRSQAEEELVKRRKSAVIDSAAQAIATVVDANQLVKIARARDLRSSPRQHFEAEQRIAPLLSDEMPAEHDFRVVHCRDISTGGMAFVIDQRPTYQKIMVALGRIPEIIYVTAEIVRVTPITVDGNRKFIVGCHFTGRCKF